MNKAILLVFLFGLVLTDGETSGTCVIEWTSSTVALSTKSKEFFKNLKSSSKRLTNLSKLIV